MIELFNATAFKCSKLITQAYSTSFSMGIWTLHPKLHDPIYAIYGFVRYADEIVDTFHDYDKKSLLERFEQDTYRAIEEKISLNPILQSFQLTVNQYYIEKELIEAFLDSMAMDLHRSAYDASSYKQYIYGSAEVVGLMCLRVFCKGDKELYETLKEPACRLGAAFQKVNFLRDMKSDFEDRGRVYFPDVSFQQFNKDAKKQIEADIQADFDHAYEYGITKLPKEAQLGVYLAYIYYLNLFEKICNAPAEKVMHERIRVPNRRKITLLLESYVKHRFNYI